MLPQSVSKWLKPDYFPLVGNLIEQMLKILFFNVLCGSLFETTVAIKKNNYYISIVPWLDIHLRFNIEYSKNILNISMH